MPLIKHLLFKTVYQFQNSKWNEPKRKSKCSPQIWWNFRKVWKTLLEYSKEFSQCIIYALLILKRQSFPWNSTNLLESSAAKARSCLFNLNSTELSPSMFCLLLKEAKWLKTFSFVVKRKQNIAVNWLLLLNAPIQSGLRTPDGLLAHRRASSPQTGY